MIQEIGERESRRVARSLEPSMELLAQRDVERAEDEIVGFFHTDLTARLGEKRSHLNGNGREKPNERGANAYKRFTYPPPSSD